MTADLMVAAMLKAIIDLLELDPRPTSRRPDEEAILEPRARSSCA